MLQLNAKRWATPRSKVIRSRNDPDFSVNGLSYRKSSAIMSGKNLWTLACLCFDLRWPIVLHSAVMPLVTAYWLFVGYEINSNPRARARE